MAAPGIAVPGTVIPSGVLVTPGGPQGIGGIQGPSGPNAVSAQAGNQAVLGTDNLIYVPDPTPVITSVRLRSFNALGWGNCNFEVDQRNCGTLVTAIGTGKSTVLPIDRWQISNSAATGMVNSGQSSANVAVPNGNQYITSKTLLVGVATTQATLAAGEYLLVSQQVEGPQLRELLNDVHSISILAYCDVAINFAVSLVDNNSTHSWVSPLQSVPAGGGYTFLTMPNIPKWMAAGNWTVAPGSVGYQLRICLGCGSTYQAPSTGWQNGNFLAPSGITNFLASASGKNFILGFLQHEPGPCTQLMDLDFATNLDRCLRYFQKSYQYKDPIGTVSGNGSIVVNTPANSLTMVPGVQFRKPMAKIPTVTIYNGSTGAANSVWTGASIAVSSVANVGDSGFGWATLGSNATAGNYLNYHYSADTGL